VPPPKAPINEKWPRQSPRVLARTPYGYFDTDLLRNEPTQAGFDKIAIETVNRQSVAPSAHDLATGFAKDRRYVAKSKSAIPTVSVKRRMRRPRLCGPGSVTGRSLGRCLLM
jgi:hypothetical protein